LTHPSSNSHAFVYPDHLGSNVLSDLTGTAVVGSEAHYLPFGGYRGSVPTQTLTDRGYTGQKENLDLGLMYYNARYYLPGIGKFASAGTLIPDPANPQAFKRYSYILNNPINFVDPTGCAYDASGNEDRANHNAC